MGVVTFEHLLDALDRAVQLADQIFIGSGQQIGKKLPNLRPNLSIFLAVVSVCFFSYAQSSTWSETAVLALFY